MSLPLSLLTTKLVPFSHLDKIGRLSDLKNLLTSVFILFGSVTRMMGSQISNPDQIISFTPHNSNQKFWALIPDALKQEIVARGRNR